MGSFYAGPTGQERAHAVKNGRRQSEEGDKTTLWAGAVTGLPARCAGSPVTAAVPQLSGVCRTWDWIWS